MEAALSLILDPAARRLSEVEMYHWVANSVPSPAFSPVFEEVKWLPGVFLYEVMPAFARTELAKELTKDEVLRLNYREGCCLAVELRTREYRGYVPETRIVTFQGAEFELYRAVWALRGLPYTPVFQELSEPEVQTLSVYPSISVVVVGKGEGAPCSVSYMAEWSCWALSCKHDSLLVRESQDIRTEGRWRSVGKFAELWLREVAALSADSLQVLQQRLTDVTLVGEFGSDKTLVLMHDPGFRWYAAVPKSDPCVCLPMSTIEPLFSAFPFLIHSSQITETDSGHLAAVLTALAQDQSTGPMDICGREALVLIESQRSVLAAFQVKNAEYGLYIRLFDALALALRKEVPISVPLLKIQREAGQLSAKGLLPRPGEYYEGLIKAAFDCLNAESALFRSDFLSFLQESQRWQLAEYFPSASCSSSIVLITPPLYYTIAELKQIQLALGLSHPIAWEWREALRERPAGLTLYSLHLIPRISDEFDRSALLVFAGFCEEGKAIAGKRLAEAKRAPAECPGVFSFLKSPDCEGRLNRLISQGASEAVHLMRTFPANVLIFSLIAPQELAGKIAEKLEFVTEAPPKSVIQHQKPTRKQLKCILVPLGIPGMGKSCLIPKLREVASALECEFEVISSDAIREQCMKAYMQKHKAFDRDTVFERTASSAKNQFYGRLRDILHSSPKRILIYLDKNHPPNAVQPLMKELKQWSGLTIVAVFPQCSGFTPTHFPLSVAFFAQCLCRAVRRSGHETLTGSTVKRTEVVLMMFQMFRGFRMDDIPGLGFDSVLYVPFTDENLEIPEEFARAIIDAATGVAPKSQPASAITGRLATLVEQWTAPLPQVDPLQALLTGLQAICD